MSYSLGIDLGTTYTSAAIHEHDRASIVELSTRSATIPSVVFLAEDGTFLTGDTANRRALMDPGRAGVEFKRRFGDTAPLLLGGTPMSADQLATQLFRSVADQVTEQRGAAPERVAVTHPAGWGSYKLELLDQSVRHAGLGDATMLTEPEAAVLHYASLERIPAEAVVAVFDLGGGTFDAAVIRKTASGTEFLGRPDGIERLGGIDFDAAIFAFVDAQTNGAISDLDASDPMVASALARLRAECVEAKVALSVDDVADVAVLLPGLQTTVRIGRADFESAIRPAIGLAIDALERAISSAGIEPSALDAVLLAGGSSRIPVVAEMVTGELGRPVAVDAHPKHVVALGAALAAGTAATVADAPLRTAPPRGIVPLEAVTGAAALAAATGGDPTAPSIPIIIQQTPTNPIPVQLDPAAGNSAAITTPMPATDPAATDPAATDPAATAAMATTPPAGSPATTAMPATAAPLVPPAGAPDDVLDDEDEDSRRGMVIAAVVAAVIALGGLLAFALTNLGGGDDDEADPVTTDDVEPVVTASGGASTVPVVTDAPTTTDAPSTTAAPVATTAPPDTTVAPAPPPPYPPETRRTELTGISIVGAVYEVTYDTINFEPDVTDFHVHFFWDTQTPASVGTASDPIGDWVVWDLNADGEKIYDAYSHTAIPDGATQICAVVANSAHAVDAPEWVDDTVSCIDLL